MTIIYKICPAASWQAAESEGVFRGSESDLVDGFIHFSTAEQIAETASKHFAGQNDLIVAAVDSVRLGPSLRWEPARSGDLFPHLYSPLDLAAVLWVETLPLGAGGKHQFPALVK